MRNRSKPFYREIQIGYPLGRESHMKSSSTLLSNSILRSFLLVTFINAGLLAQEVEVDAPGDLSKCSQSYSWHETGKIPIIDPMSRQDDRVSQDQMARLHQEIRQEIESRLRKKGWSLNSSSPCQVRYSLIQQLDLGIAQNNAGGMIPRNTEGGGDSATGALDSFLERMGNMTIEFLHRGSETNDWIWQGRLTDELGKPKDHAGKAKDMVEEIIDELP